MERKTLIWFAVASLSPALVLTIALLAGGPWTVVALVYVTLFVALADRIGAALPLREDAAAVVFARNLATGLAVLQLGMLLLGVWALTAPAHLGLGETVCAFVALGLYLGQTGNSNAHELIHMSNRIRRRLGATFYAAILFGHHASAHPKVHHRFVASDDDPNSARLGEGFYAFWLRAWTGSFVAGFDAENDMRRRNGRSPRLLTHPYIAHISVSAAFLILAIAIGGPAGLFAHVMLAAYAQMQLMLSDYVQHYGLRRGQRANGQLEPVGPQHSWNAPHWYSSAMMLNAPRHSDHHTDPGRPFPALRLDATKMPMLPASLPSMATLALFPNLWRRVMDRRVKAWINRPLPVAVEDTAHAF